MIPASLRVINVLRRDAAAYAARGAREELRQVEEKIEHEIAARIAAPECPFCGGAVADTSTKGRLECVDCGAIMLVGHERKESCNG